MRLFLRILFKVISSTCDNFNWLPRASKLLCWLPRALKWGLGLDISVLEHPHVVPTQKTFHIRLGHNGPPYLLAIPTGLQII